MNRSLGPPVAIAAAGLIVALLVAAGAAGPVRTAAATGFLLCGPGLAWVRLLRLPDRTTEWTIGVVASLGIDAAVATALLTTGLWSPGWALGAVVAVAVAGSMLDAGSAIRRRSVGGDEQVVGARSAGRQRVAGRFRSRAGSGGVSGGKAGDDERG